MEAVEVYNKVQRYRKERHQTENEMRLYLDFYKVRSEELKKEADDLQSFLCSGKYSNWWHAHKIVEATKGYILLAV